MSSDRTPGQATLGNPAHDVPSELRKALAALSSLITNPSLDALSDPAANPTLQSAHVHLSRVLVSDQLIELCVHPDGHITIAHHTVLAVDPTTHRHHLGKLLCSHGVEVLHFVAPVSLDDLSLWVAILQFHTQPTPDPENDLVTHWFEQENSHIIFAHTAAPSALKAFSDPTPAIELGAPSFLISNALLQTAYNPASPRLAVRPPRPEPPPASSASASLSRTFTPSATGSHPRSLTPSAASLSRLPTPVSFSRTPTGHALPPLVAAPQWQPLDARARVVLDMLLQPLTRETDATSRKQFMHTLLAATSAREPAISPQEFAFLFNKLFIEFINAGEFEDAFQLTRNLEHFLERTAKVQSITRDIATVAIARMRSVRGVLQLTHRLSQADHFQPPRPLTRWLLTNDPLPLWSQAIAQVPPDNITTLTSLFQTIFLSEDPFWTAALAAIPPDRAPIANEIISQFGHTEMFGQASQSQWQGTPSLNSISAAGALNTRSPSKIIVRGESVSSSAPSTTTQEQSWEDFDMDNLPMDPEDDIHLDDDMAAFLDGGTPPPSPKPQVPSDMIRSLDDIELDVTHYKDKK